MATQTVIDYRRKLASLTPENKRIWDLAHKMMNEMMHSENASIQYCDKAAARHHDANGRFLGTFCLIVSSANLRIN